MKPFITVFSGLLVAGSLLHAQESTLLDESLLSRLRSEAARNHPASTAATLREQAAREDIHTVRLWDDPMAGLSLMGADQMMRQDDGDISLMVEQPLPKPGLYQANRTRAEALQRAENQKVRVTTLELGAIATRHAIELALADESIRLQSSQLEWLEGMTKNARERTINPGATSVETLRLESEMVKETQILEAAKRTRQSLAQRLNLMLGRPIQSPWPSLRLPEKSLPTPVGKSEIARIPRTNPTVKSMQETASAATAETRITERERQPGFAVTAESNIYSGGDYRSTVVGIRLNLPWFNERSYQAKTNAAANREKAAIADTASTIREIEGQVLAAVTEAANAAAQADAFSGEIQNKARLANESIQASWISSSSTLNELLESRRMLFSIRLDQHRFIAMQLAALEELNVLVPRP